MVADHSFESFLDHVGLTVEDVNPDTAYVDSPIEECDNTNYCLGDSTIHGKGTFATKNIDGYVGKLKSRDSWYVLGRYANHSATPTAKVEMSSGEIVVTGCVEEGQEITVDYFEVRDLIKFQNAVIVVDDFCEDIELVRDSLLAAGTGTWRPNKGQIGSSVYDGMGFVGYHALMLRPLIGAVRNVMVPNSMFFRVTNEGMEKAYIHSDREYGSYTAVVYLSSHDTPSGTAFYRHIPTGLTEMPTFEEMKELGIFEQLSEDMTSRDPSKWEQLDFVEGRFNRALIFDAPLFHSRFPVEGIADNNEDGRLVWVSHFYKLNGYGELF